MRLRAGEFTAIDGLRAERMIVCRQRSGCVQTTLRKCTDPEVSSLFQRAVSVSGRVTATETLRVERMCANNGRIWRQRA